MRLRRLALTLAVTSAALALLTTAVRAATHVPAGAVGTSPQSRLEQIAGFTRVQTVTIVSSPIPTATALTTFWENTWFNLNVQFGFPLPADFADVSVSGGTFSIITNTTLPPTAFGEVFTNKVDLQPFGGGQPLQLSYSTNSRAVREGNQFRIVVRANSQLTSTYLTTIQFDDSLYEFVSFSDHLPTDTLPLGPPNQNPNRVAWGPVPVIGGDLFDKDVVLADERLTVDLAVKSYGVTLAPDHRSVQVTATIVNSGSVQTGNQFVVELYDRPPSIGAPGGPNDHKWGICLAAASCGYNDYRFANAAIIANLLPGQTTGVAYNYRFGTAGNRRLYLQVDTFGGNVGFNFEPLNGENNNITFLGVYPAVANLYLPLVTKS